MNILFDLDGTLTDPRVGIIRCIQHALEVLNGPKWRNSDLERFIGPPLHESFKEILGTTDGAAAWEALQIYRERYSRVGFLENEVYPGVPQALEALRRAGHHLWIATSKPTVYACNIAEHFQLAKHFEGIYGSELDGARTGKADLIKFILEREGLSPAESVMVGDRRHDAEGAGINGLRSIGVLWGLGSEKELKEAGADQLVNRPDQLSETFLSS